MPESIFDTAASLALRCSFARAGSAATCCRSKATVAPWRVVLVVTARRTLACAGHDGGEASSEAGDPARCLFAIGIQPGLSQARFSHLRRLSFKVTIPNAGT
jgi:hypothetical protein